MSDAALVALILVVGMFALMAIGVSVSVSIAALRDLLGDLDGSRISIYPAQKIYNGVDSFALLAILVSVGRCHHEPGRYRSRLIDFAKALVGLMSSSMDTNVLACMLFGSISGSARAGICRRRDHGLKRRRAAMT